MLVRPSRPGVGFPHNRRVERLEDLDFDLPERLIAQTPLDDRAGSRLFVLPRDGSPFRHAMFRDVPTVLRPGDLLVVNDSRVDAVRIHGRRATGGEVEALLTEERSPNVWEALLKPAKRVKLGETLDFGGTPGRLVEIDGDRRVLDFPEGLPPNGETPLPPYIHEKLDDAERYQTVFARAAGSAAAPTAGLHFTPEIVSALEANGIGVATVTLHVGIDTFRPLTTGVLAEHRMHGERAEIPPETAALVETAEGRIVAVGTTAVRTLEGMADGPRRLRVGRERIEPFIRPGWRWNVVDGMFTNFHLPRTTMLAMLAALVGADRLREAYAEAIREEYRWASFGDSMLIEPERTIGRGRK